MTSARTIVQEANPDAVQRAGGRPSEEESNKCGEAQFVLS